MKLLINKLNGNTASIDIITEEKGVLNTYENEADFWSSGAPIASADVTPPADYDTLSVTALEMLGPDWEMVERD